MNDDIGNWEKKGKRRKDSKKSRNVYQEKPLDTIVSPCILGKSDKEQGLPSQQNIAIGLYCDSNGHRRDSV